MISSIKAKVLLFYISIFFIILLISGIALYFTLNKIIMKSIDDALLSKAQALATLIENDSEGGDFKFSDEIMWEYSSIKSISYFQIRKQDGTTIEKSPSLSHFNLPFNNSIDRTTFDTFYLNDKPVRVVNFYFQEKSLIIQCAQNIAKEINLLKNYKIALLILIPSIIMVSAIGGFLIVKKSTAPIINFSNTVNRISEENLSERIDITDLPDELRTLAISFNRTFERLEKAFNIQKQFIADAAHQLRTPLTVIRTQCDVMLRKRRQPDEYENALITIKNVADTMSSMVRKLLTLARLTRNEIEFKKEEVNLNEIIQNVVTMLSFLAEQNGLTMTVHSNRVFWVHGDKALLTELFVNLVENAIKYNKPYGKIDVLISSDSENSEFISVKVKDTGAGIPKEDIEKVFERFYRVNRTRATEDGSSGLGLSICKEIVKLHKGKIYIESELGKGTTVTVYLKRKQVKT
ncbi:sensor histidine kinase [Thermodesulfovibrio sp. TK110]